MASRKRIVAQSKSDAALLTHIAKQVLTSSGALPFTGMQWPLPSMNLDVLAQMSNDEFAHNISFYSPIHQAITLLISETNNVIISNNFQSVAFLNGIADELFARNNPQDTKVDIQKVKSDINSSVYIHEKRKPIDCEDSAEESDDDSFSKSKNVRRQWLIEHIIACDSVCMFTICPTAFSSFTSSLLSSSNKTSNPSRFEMLSLFKQILEEILFDESWRLELKLATSESTKSAVLDKNKNSSSSSFVQDVSYDEAMAEPSVLSKSFLTGESNAQHLWYATPVALIVYRLYIQLSLCSSTISSKNGKFGMNPLLSPWSHTLQHKSSRHHQNNNSINMSRSSNSNINASTFKNWWFKLSSTQKGNLMKEVISFKFDTKKLKQTQKSNNNSNLKQTKNDFYSKERISTWLISRFFSLGISWIVEESNIDTDVKDTDVELTSNVGRSEGSAGWLRLIQGRQEDSAAIGAVLFEVFCLYPIGNHSFLHRPGMIPPSSPSSSSTSSSSSSSTSSSSSSSSTSSSSSSTSSSSTEDTNLTSPLSFDEFVMLYSFVQQKWSLWFSENLIQEFSIENEQKNKNRIPRRKSSSSSSSNKKKKQQRGFRKDKVPKHLITSSQPISAESIDFVGDDAVINAEIKNQPTDAIMTVAENDLIDKFENLKTTSGNIIDNIVNDSQEEEEEEVSGNSMNRPTVNDDVADVDGQHTTLFDLLHTEVLERNETLELNESASHDVPPLCSVAEETVGGVAQEDKHNVIQSDLVVVKKDQVDDPACNSTEQEEYVLKFGDGDVDLKAEALPNIDQIVVDKGIEVKAPISKGFYERWMEEVDSDTEEEEEEAVMNGENEDDIDDDDDDDDDDEEEEDDEDEDDEDEGFFSTTPRQNVMRNNNTETAMFENGPLDLIAWDAWQLRMDSLSDDIVEMAAMLKTVADRRRPWQGGALSRVRELALSLWPSSKLHVFGSFESGLAIPASDIDVVITGVPVNSRLTPAKISNVLLDKGMDKGALPPLEAFARELKRQDWVSSVVALPRTAVPIIKLQTASVPTSFGAMAVISMDISFIFDVSSSSSPYTDGDHNMTQRPSNITPLMAPTQPPNAMMPFSSLVPNSHWLSSSSSSHKLSSFDAQINHHQHYSQQQQQHNQSLQWQQQQHQQQHHQFHHQQQPQQQFNSLSIQQQPQHMGVENTQFVSRLCSLHPPLAALVLVLKQLLHEKGLNDPFKGGLGAYALTVMAAAVCQRHALQPPPEKPSIGMLFVNFLETYGTRGLDTRRSCVTLAPAGPLLPLSLHHFNTPRVGSAGFWQPAPPVVIVDPLHPALNVAQSCFGFRQVQICFDNALQTLLHCPMDQDYSGLTSQVAQQNEIDEFHSGNMSRNGTLMKTSILGAIFGASHHKQVVNLSASIWCPLEHVSTKSHLNHSSSAPSISSSVSTPLNGNGSVETITVVTPGVTNQDSASAPSIANDDEVDRTTPSFFVSSLSVAELEELTSLLGRATPLTNIETLRVQRLMKQTTPQAASPQPYGIEEEEDGDTEEFESKLSLELNELSDDEIKRRCIECVNQSETREKLIELAKILLC